MLFNSFTFLVFFAIVIPLYYLIPHKIRWLHLLVSSYIFYMAWSPPFILLIIFSTFSDYVLSWKIYTSKTQKLKKRYLITSICINFTLLFIFKYSMLINETFMTFYVEVASFFYTLQGNTKEVAREMAQAMLSGYPLQNYSIILPMGISFYTFQVVAYVVDVYRGIVKPIKHYGVFSLYITFFPQLVAGPIERSKDLIPQFYKKHTFDKERILYGLKIMMYGFFKKVVIADRISIAVNTVYNSPESHTGLHMLIATILFAIQIYCDFSGYSDIAVGIAKVLGFNLSENFKNPFFSKSIKEVWKRWHISLSSWFVDYLYIPLGGNRQGKNRYLLNLFLTFIISGFWHGANWTYLLWGAFQGTMIVIQTLIDPYVNGFLDRFNLHKNILVNFIRVSLTFFLFSYSLIFFRGNNIADSFYVLNNIFLDIGSYTDKQYVYEVITSFGLSVKEIQILLITISFLFIGEMLCDKKQVYAEVEKMSYPFRLTYYVILGTFILTTGVFYASGEFIYFQF